MNAQQSAKVSSSEVIDELTKDLEKSCVKNDEFASENQGTEVDDTCLDGEEKIEEIESDHEEEYFVDESALKDRDLDLLDEEKQELKKKSDNLKNKGNDLFRDGDYTGATSTYTEGLRICPLIFERDRAILYANRAASMAKIITDKTLAIDDCTKAIELDSNYVKAYLRRAHLYEETDKLDEALADYKKVLTFDPSHTQSIFAIQKLEPIINERNEKLKEEMLGKLKDLGNMILRPFGLSTSNFQMDKDENTGGYSVKFNQNPT